MIESHIAYYKSPIGYFEITGSVEGLHSLEFLDEDSVPESEVPLCLITCFEQLDEYFAGTRTEFNLRLKPKGTDFQNRVWQQLLKIPFGKTVSYLDIAKALGNEKAIRAVGAANGRNRIPVIIPCHRVIGSDGSLIGFGGGIWRKEFLLRHEGAVLV
ncbi:MAG: methylated-DNA--[protein]-cysteine S-methyltransferase [bacterium]